MLNINNDMRAVLNIHEITDPAWFEKFILDLRKEFHFVEFKDLIHNYDSPKSHDKICHITVDDGDTTFYSVIFPILRKYEIHSTVFLSPDILINQGNFWFQEITDYKKEGMLLILADVLKIRPDYISNFPVVHILKCLKIDLIWEIIERYRKKYKEEKKPGQNMNISELKELQKTGLVSFGAHSMRHPILANEELSVSKQEIINSIQCLVEITGQKITSFAYPNGEPKLDFGEREINILKENDCQYAFSTKPGSLASESDLFNIPRFGSSTGESIHYFKLKMFFGPFWSQVMRVKPNNEFANRKSLMQILEK